MTASDIAVLVVSIGLVLVFGVGFIVFLVRYGIFVDAYQEKVNRVLRKYESLSYEDITSTTLSSFHEELERCRVTKYDGYDDATVARITNINY